MTRQQVTGAGETPTKDQPAPDFKANLPAESKHPDGERSGSGVSPADQADVRNERWPWMSWMYSLTLPIAIWLALVSMLVATMTATETVTFTVIDQATNAPVPNADLIVANLVYRTDNNGEVRIERPKSNEPVTVRADGYMTVTGEWTNRAGNHQEVPIRPTELTGATSVMFAPFR